MNVIYECSSRRLPLLFVIVGILLALMILGALITATVALQRRRQNKIRAREESNYI